MGARINYVFKANMEEPYITLYSHWGESTWFQDLANSISAARSRWTDDSYCLRIIIDQLTKESRDVDTGHGIFLSTTEDLKYLDHPVIIDMQAMTILDTDGTEFGWEEFLKIYKPNEFPA